MSYPPLENWPDYIFRALSKEMKTKVYIGKEQKRNFFEWLRLVKTHRPTGTSLSVKENKEWKPFNEFILNK